MLAAVLALAIAVHPAGPAVESNYPPPTDSSWLRTIVPRADGFDAYWFRHNELREPAVTRLLRTSLDLDGRIAAPTTLVAAPADRQLSTGAGLPLAYWMTEERTLFAAPLSAGVPPPGGGMLIATLAEYPSIHCEESACFARWSTLNGTSRGAFLDHSGNIVNGPFPMPGAYYEIFPMALDAEGAAMIAASGANKFSVVRILRDGTVRTNLPFLDHAVYTTAAVTHDGERAVVAYIPRPWPDEPSSLAISALAVSPDGTIENLGTLFAPEGALHLTGLSIAWNGTHYLLVGGYVDPSYVPRLYAVELDRQLQVVAAANVAAQFSYGAGFQVVPNGDRFAIGWSYLKPMATIYHAGSLSTPVILEDVPRTPRRRLVRR
jgi:hypothetical protein